MSPIYSITVPFLITVAIIGSPLIQAVHYQVIDNAVGTAGSTRFENEIGIPYTFQTIQQASDFIRKIFNQIEFGEDRKSVDQVTVAVEAFAGPGPWPAAYTQNNKISLSSNYIQNFNGDVRVEVIGLLYHEATHVWQWNGNGEAPMGLIEGIADYVRLKAGLAPLSWAPRGAGDRWDHGYAVTAYFLDYCNGLKGGFVAELNAMMRFHYSDHYFVQLLGKSVDQLWSEYKSKFWN